MQISCLSVRRSSLYNEMTFVSTITKCCNAKVPQSVVGVGTGMCGVERRLGPYTDAVLAGPALPEHQDIVLLAPLLIAPRVPTVPPFRALILR